MAGVGDLLVDRVVCGPPVLARRDDKVVLEVEAGASEALLLVL